MRISDWSSDVCSSDLYIAPRIGRVRVRGIDLSDDNNYGTGGFSWIRDDGGNHNVDAAQIAALEIRWYVPGDYAGKNLSFSYTRDVHDAGGDDEEDRKRVE